MHPRGWHFLVVIFGSVIILVMLLQGDHEYSTRFLISGMLWNASIKEGSVAFERFILANSLSIKLIKKQGKVLLNHFFRKVEII